MKTKPNRRQRPGFKRSGARLCAKHQSQRCGWSATQPPSKESTTLPNKIVSKSIAKSPTGIRGLDEITGDLSNTERVLVGLDLRPATPASIPKGARHA